MNFDISIIKLYLLISSVLIKISRKLKSSFFLFVFFGEGGGEEGGWPNSNNKILGKKKNESCKPNFHDTNLSSAI